MSKRFAKTGELYYPEYKDGMTKQSFKDSTDINKILDKARKGHAISHVNRFGAEYGDFTDMPDLLTAHERLKRAQEIFDELPAEVKREFGQDPQSFFAFANDPKNSAKLAEVLPQITETGNYKFPGKGFADVAPEGTRERVENVALEPEVTPPIGGGEPQTGSEG